MCHDDSMSRFRLGRVARWLGFGTIAALLVLALLYRFFGLRYMPSGSGIPAFGFLTGHDEQAAAIARHRASQRADAERAAPSRAPLAGPEPGDSSRGAAPETAIGAEADAGSITAIDRGASIGSTGQTTAAGAMAGHDSAPTPATPPYWTDLRGPARDGRYDERPLLRQWPAQGLRPLWRQPVGGGYAAFVAAKGRAFTIEQRGRQEVVAAYQTATGREIWTHGWPELFEETMGGDGPRATPTWSGGVVYALGARGELRALDETTGRMRWRVNILEDNGADNLQWGMSAAPLVVGNTVIVLPGGPRGRSVVAYDTRTGRRVWSAQDDPAGYASPFITPLAGRDQLIVLSGTRLMGLDPENGALFWSYPWVTTSGINVAQPMAIGGNRLFVSSAYGVGAAVVEVTARESGFDVREIWRNNRMKNKFASSVLHNGFIFGLDEAILACIDAATGQLKWKGGRYGYGQILLAGDRIVVLTEEGELVLVEASSASHRELGRSPAIPGKSWNHLAVDNGVLLARNGREMAAFDLRAP
jgi:outer membrane protein assembly factor BamB